MKIKCNYKILILGLINLVLGILFLVINSGTLLTIMFYLIGAVVIINGGYSLYKAIKSKNTLEIIWPIIDIIFGICLIFFHKTFMLVIVAVYLIVLPIVRIIMAPDHKGQLLIELPRLILGLVLILLTPEGALNVLFKVVGVLLLVIGIIVSIGSFCTERYLD